MRLALKKSHEPMQMKDMKDGQVAIVLSNNTCYDGYIVHCYHNPNDHSHEKLFITIGKPWGHSWKGSPVLIVRLLEVGDELVMKEDSVC